MGHLELRRYTYCLQKFLSKYSEVRGLTPPTESPEGGEWRWGGFFSSRQVDVRRARLSASRTAFKGQPDGFHQNGISSRLSGF